MRRLASVSGLRSFLAGLKKWSVVHPTALPPSATPALANPGGWQGDALCFVLADARRASRVYVVLNHFLPQRDPLWKEPELMDEDVGIAFTDEAQLLRYLEDNPTRNATRYWYPRANNPDNYMVGAHFTTDGCLLLSLTLPANKAAEDHCLAAMKSLLRSEAALIWHNSFPDFPLTGERFRQQCATSI